MICLIKLLSSCELNKEDTLYNLDIVNNYFENVDSCFFHIHKQVHLPIDSIWSLKKIESGEYPIVFYTHSELRIETKVNLMGDRSKIRIRLLENGIIELDYK